MRSNPTILLSLLFLGGAALSVETHGESNLIPGKSSGWGSNIGWIDWRADVIHGVEIDQFICAGFIYSANVGWIDMGGGVPRNPMGYGNVSADDYGVNVDSQGYLHGFAYGANIGWISFPPEGHPRIDLNSGKFSGSAYGANVGWISLGDASFELQVSSLGEGEDSDLDGIPDAWEIAYANNLTTLGANSDFDHDGQSDLEEYLADTDPTDPSDNLRILDFSMAPDHSSVTMTWPAHPTRRYFIQTRRDFHADTLWIDSDFSVAFPDAPRGSMTLPQNPAGPANYFQIRAVRPLAP